MSIPSSLSRALFKGIRVPSKEKIRYTEASPVRFFLWNSS
jgi:hypothetical protein